MKKLVLLILVLFISSVAGSELDQRIDDLNEMLSFHDEMCKEQNTVYQFSDRNFDCEEESENLGILFEEIDDEIGVELLFAGEQCTVDNENVLINDILDIGEKLTSCDQSSKDCLTDLYCNSFSSIIPVGDKMSGGIYRATKYVYKKLDLDIDKSSALPFLKKCSDMKQGNCLYSALRGLFDSIFTSIDALWGLGKIAASKSWDWIKSKFVDEEDITSDKLLVASQMDDSLIDQFLNDPLAFIKDLTKLLYDTSVLAIKSHYGCEKWSGLPMASTCITPMQSFDCSSCTQKMNAVCGVVGFLGGEIITNYLTGAAVGAVKSGMSLALKAGSKGVAKMGKLLIPIKKAGSLKTAYTASNSALKAVSAAIKATKGKWLLLKASRLSMALKEKARKLLILTNKVTLTKTYVVASTVPKTVRKGIRSYFKLVDKGLLRGARSGQIGLRLITKGEKAVRSAEISQDLLLMFEKEPALAAMAKYDPETINIVFSKQAHRHMVKDFFENASQNERKNCSLILEEISKNRLSGEREQLADKLYEALNRCIK